MLQCRLCIDFIVIFNILVGLRSSARLHATVTGVQYTVKVKILSVCQRHLTQDDETQSDVYKIYSLYHRQIKLVNNIIDITKKEWQINLNLDHESEIGLTKILIASFLGIASFSSHQVIVVRHQFCVVLNSNSNRKLATLCRDTGNQQNTFSFSADS